jgi:hypothetical protein
MRAVGGTLGLRIRVFWLSIYKSYALIPGVLIGPMVYIIAVPPARHLSEFWTLVVFAILGLLGWIGGVVLLKHPIKAETLTTLHAMIAWLRLRGGRQ